MRESALGGAVRGLDVATYAHTLTTGRRVALAVVVLLHGFAHANAVIWAGQAVPLWITTLFWGVAVLGYLGAGFGLLRVPLVRRHYRPLMTAATIASIALLTIIGGTIAFVGVAVDLFFLTVVVHWTRTGDGDVDPAPALLMIKTFHTVAWAFFAGAILAIPVATWLGEFAWVAGLIAVVLVEVAILALNHMRCPLTAIAARYTEDRRANFDIYLPLWLAANNKQVFGTLFCAGLLFALFRWILR